MSTGPPACSSAYQWATPVSMIYSRRGKCRAGSTPLVATESNHMPARGFNPAEAQRYRQHLSSPSSCAAACEERRSTLSICINAMPLQRQQGGATHLCQMLERC